MPVINQNKPIMEGKLNKNSINPTLYSRIFNTPAVRDLPRIAALHGLYGTFIIGQKGVYFAYGYDRHFLEGDVVETRGLVYPKAWLSRYGYFKSDAPLMSTKFTAFRLPEDPMETHKVLMQQKTLMGYIEYFIQRFKVNGLRIPDFMIIDQMALSMDLTAPVMTGKYIRPEMREAALKKEREALLSIAVYNWPLDPSTFRPDGGQGIHIALLFGYLAGKDPNKEIKHPNRWMKNFRSMSNNALIERNVAPNCAEFIKRGFDRMHVPYMSEIDFKSVRKEREMNRRIGLASGDVHLMNLMESCETIAFPAICLGFFDWLLDEFLETAFTSEEKRIGNEMLKKSCNELATERNGSPLQYITYIYRGDLVMFRRYCQEHSIKWGHPSAAWLKYGGNDNEVAIITDITSMPLIMRYVYHWHSSVLSQHLACLEQDSPGDVRIPYRDTHRAIYTYREPWGLENGTLDVTVQDLSGRAMAVKLPTKDYWFGGLSRPLKEYYAEGSIVDLGWGDTKPYEWRPIFLLQRNK